MIKINISNYREILRQTCYYSGQILEFHITWLKALAFERSSASCWGMVCSDGSCSPLHASPPWSAAVETGPSSVQPLTSLPARRIFRKAVLLKRQVAAFTRPRLAFLLLHKRPSGGWQKGGSVYCTLKPPQRAARPLCQMLDTAKPVNT